LTNEIAWSKLLVNFPPNEIAWSEISGKQAPLVSYTLSNRDLVVGMRL